jgi:hypothetical protein
MIELDLHNPKESISLLKENFNKGNIYLLWEGLKEDGDNDIWVMTLKSIDLNGIINGCVRNMGTLSRNNKDWLVDINIYFFGKDIYRIFILNKDEFTPYNNQLIVSSLEK